MVSSFSLVGGGGISDLSSDFMKTSLKAYSEQPCAELFKKNKKQKTFDFQVKEMMRSAIFHCVFFFLFFFGLN